MKPLRNLLVVVDPTAKEHPCVAKAARIAGREGSRVQLLVCDFPPAIRPGYLDELASPAEAAELVRTFLERKLGELAVVLRHQGIAVSTRVALERPLHEAVLRRIRQELPDLVVKDTHYHSAVRRALFTNTDWHLIRESPAPLLLVRSTPWPDAGPRIAAALDPAHPGDRAASLDRRILAVATLLRQATGGSLLAVHAVDMLGDLPLAAGDPAALGGGLLARNVVAQVHARRRERLLELAGEAGLGADDVTLLEGPPAEVLPALAAERDLDVMVMGAVARGGLGRVFIGSTAERVLDRLPCDVLVVRPPDADAAPG